MQANSQGGIMDYKMCHDLLKTHQTCMNFCYCSWLLLRLSWDENRYIIWMYTYISKCFPSAGRLLCYRDDQ